MNIQSPYISWDSVDSDRWAFSREKKNATLLVFELPKLPNFSEPRFKELGDTLDNRKTEVARRQMQMLRQLHSFGKNVAFSLRLRKDNNQIRLFIVCRLISDSKIKSDVIAQNVLNTFPKEYSFIQIQEKQNPLQWTFATDLSWAKYSDDLIKPEKLYDSHSWPYFYSSQLLHPSALNNFESVCRTVLKFSGEALVDLTLVPTKLVSSERDWLDRNIFLLRKEHSGDSVTNPQGKVLTRFDPVPLLKAPLENYENLLKRYEVNPLFVYAFRIFTTNDPFPITQSISSSATRSKPHILSFEENSTLFKKNRDAAERVDIEPDIRSDWWEQKNHQPLRAQRLHRIVDLDELTNFWRLPIPTESGFPGFELDIGTVSTSKGIHEPTNQLISLGAYADDSSKANLKALFNFQGLAKHGLIVGVPGSGKTTTVFNILYQLWNSVENREQIPFIVLEPAKTEYRALKTTKAFQDDLLVFTLGDERVSPFRFNPFEVPTGIPVESHISKLNTCFMGAFNLFDPLPLLLDKAIRQTYEVKGWFDDSIGGEPGLDVPTLSDLCLQAEDVINNSGYSDRLRDDFNAALLQRLQSLRRGSKGRMLDTKKSISFDLLMRKPIVLELDALNEDEKALMMMFILTFVYEYAKSARRSGSPLRHLLVVEEAHNLIGRGDTGGGEFKANPKDTAIRLFTRMLAEMRALGQGILIADQLPTALASEAVKQTNLKILMRMTAMDDRVEIGNTMDLGEKELKAVSRFKSGQAYIYHEALDRVRQVQAPNFKKDHGVEEPQSDAELNEEMSSFEESDSNLFMPYVECQIGCKKCNRRVRGQAERYIRKMVASGRHHINHSVKGTGAWGTLCRAARLKFMAEAKRIQQEYQDVDQLLPFCAYVHLLNFSPQSFELCEREQSECECLNEGRQSRFDLMLGAGQKVVESIEAIDN